jgi:hypothetical protein
VVVGCENQRAEALRNPQRFASVVLLRGRAMDENKRIKTNVSFESAGLKLAVTSYTPDHDRSLPPSDCPRLSRQ